MVFTRELDADDLCHEDQAAVVGCTVGHTVLNAASANCSYRGLKGSSAVEHRQRPVVA